MPGIEDYFPPGDPTKPKKADDGKGKGIQDFFEVDKSPNKSTMSMGRNTSVKLDEYTPYIKGGVNSDFNIDLQRAQNQGTLETIGKTLGNTVVNIATGVGEMVGYAGALVTEWGDDRDYSNFLTKKMQEWHNPLGEVYRENPNAVWDMGDSAWWANNLGQLVESAAAFALPGGEIAKGFEWAAKSAAEAFKLGKTATGLVKGGAQLASAALMGYTEGAMSGYRVYDQAYNTQLQKNINAGDDYATASQKAKTVASDAASTTVQMYTKLGALLNLTAFSPLFKRADDEAYAWLSTQGKRQAGESVEGWKSRIAAAGFDNKDIAKIFAPRSGITGVGSEILQEGGEEFVQGYFDKTGEDIGNGKKRAENGMDIISDFFDKTMDSEGLLNFALGGLGGGLQTAILDNIPLHRVKKFDAASKPIFKMEDGKVALDSKGVEKYETELVSSRTRDKDKAKVYFKSVKDAIIQDIDWFQTKNQEMMDTKDPVLKESLRAQLFNINNLNAVTSGLSDAWKQQYKEVHDIDNSKSLSEALQPQIDQITQQLAEATNAGDASVPELTKARQELLAQQASLVNVTEAMQKGYAKNMDDNWYKTQAQEAIHDLGEMQKMWEVTQKKYAQTDEQKAAGLADYIFAHQTDLYHNQKILTKAEAELATMTGEYEIRHAGLTEDFDASARTYASEWEILEKQRTTLEQDIKNVDDPKVQDRYHGLEPKALRNELINKLNSINKAGHELNEGLKMSFDSSEWAQKNPGKSYDDYFKALQNKFTDRNDLNAYAAQIEDHRTRTSMLNTKLNDILTTKGILNTIKKAQSQKRDLIKEMEERNKRDVSEAALEQRKDEATRTLQKTQLSVRERQIRTEITKMEARIAGNMQVITGYESRIADIKKGTSLWKQLTRNTDLDDLKQKLTTAKYDLAIDRRRLEVLQHELDIITGKIADIAAEVPPAPIVPVPEQVVAPGPAPLTTEETADNTVDDEQEPPVITSDDSDGTNNPLEVEYFTMLSTLPQAIRDVFEAHEMAVKNGVRPFQYQALINEALAVGTGSMKDIYDTAVALKNYLESVPQPVITGTEDNPVIEDNGPAEDYGAQEYQEPVDEFEENMSGADLVPEEYKDSPETVNADIAVTGRIHKGKKATSGVTIINATLDYIDYVDKEGNYRMVSATGALNADTPEDVLRPGKLGPGTVVTLRITEYNGPTNSNALPNSFKQTPYADYFDDKGEVKRTEHAVGNIPIGIYDENNKLLGYLPTQERLTARYPGSGNLRNLADGEGANPAEEIAKNMALRQKLITSSSEGTGTITIRSKGPGSVIENQKKISDNEYQRERKSALTSLPDRSLTIGIVGDGTVYDANKSATTKDIVLTTAELRNINKAPVFLLPMADGSYMPSPIYMNPLAGDGINEIAVNSIMKVLTLLADQSQAAIDEKNKITELSGFDVNQSAGVRAYINQYWTYTEKFTALDTLADPALLKKSKRPVFLFNVTDTGLVMLGTKYTGIEPLIMNNKNQAQFREALKAGLSTRYKNVVYSNPETGLKGINSRNGFDEVFHNGKDWIQKHHSSYNEYVKANATTFANGTNQLSDKSFVYSANPQIELDDSTLSVPVVYTAAEIQVPGATTASVPSSVEATADDEELLESMGLMSLNFGTTSVQTSIEQAADMQPINLGVLTELYNFTPSGERNGLTPSQVLENMIKSGIPYIAEGHNPFIKCN